MSSIDRSLEKIDLMKLLIFLIVFIVIVFSLIFVLVIPKIKEHRILKAEYERALVHKTRVENLFLEKEGQLNKLQEENAQALGAFSHPFLPEEMVAFSKQFFTATTITPIMDTNASSSFHAYELNVTLSSKKPTALYTFLEGLNRYDNIVQANFPIYLELSDKESISSSLQIKVFDANVTSEAK